MIVRPQRVISDICISGLVVKSKLNLDVIVQISSEKQTNSLGVLIRSLVVKSELNLDIVKSLVGKAN